MQQNFLPCVKNHFYEIHDPFDERWLRWWQRGKRQVAEEVVLWYQTLSPVGFTNKKKTGYGPTGGPTDSLTDQRASDCKSKKNGKRRKIRKWGERRKERERKKERRRRKHSLVCHLKQWLRKYKEGLARFSEQTCESTHFDFGKTHQRFKRKESHQDHGKILKRSVVEYSSRRV